MHFILLSVASSTDATDMLNDSRSPGIQPDNNEKRDEPFLIGGSGLTDDEDLKVMSNL